MRFKKELSHLCIQRPELSTHFHQIFYPKQTIDRGKVLALSYLLAALQLLSSTRAVFPIATEQSVIELCGGPIGGIMKVSNGYVAIYAADSLLKIRRLNHDGQPIGPAQEIGRNLGFPPAIGGALSNDHLLIAWSDTSRTNGCSMFARIYEVSKDKLGPSFPLLQSPSLEFGFQEVIAVASDGTDFLVVWKDCSSDIMYGQYVAGSGEVSGPPFQLAYKVREAATAFGNTNYVVAWQSSSDQLHHVFVRVVSKHSGSQGQPIQISNTGSLDHNPLAVTFDGTNYLIVWNCNQSTDINGRPFWSLYARIVRQDGTPLGDEILICEEGSCPAIAFDGQHFLLIWGISGTNQTTIHARFLDRSGYPVGPIFTPLPSIAGQPPLLPTVYFDGDRFVLAVTYGNLEFDDNGDVVGISGGDVYGAFFPSSKTAPAFKACWVSDSFITGQISLVPGIPYTVEASSDLRTFSPIAVFASEDEDIVTLTDRTQPISQFPARFFRLVLGNHLPIRLQLSFIFFANAASFDSSLTPKPVCPLRVAGYRVMLLVDNDLALPPPRLVIFTGPYGSGITQQAAEEDISGTGRYVSPYTVHLPSTRLGGTWIVKYKKSDFTMTADDPLSANHLVMLLPEVSVENGFVKKVSWSYRDATTGEPLQSVPQFVTSLRLQISDSLNQLLYESPWLSPATTAQNVNLPISWSNVGTIRLIYSDTLGNYYVIQTNKQ